MNRFDKDVSTPVIYDEYDFCGRCGDWAKIWRLRDEFVMLKGRGKIANYAAAER